MPEELSPPGKNVGGKGKDKHLPQIDPDMNPEDAEVLDQEDDEIDELFSFACVVLNADDNQLGVWADAAESVKLRFLLNTKYSAPRIDIRFPIKWRDGKISYEHRPANPTFQTFGDQFKSIETLLIVDLEAPPDNAPPESTPTFEAALDSSSYNNKISVFRELRNMDFGEGENNCLGPLLENKKLWVVCITMNGAEADRKDCNDTFELGPNPADKRFGVGLFNKVKTYGEMTQVVHELRDLFYHGNAFYFVVRGDEVGYAIDDFEQLRLNASYSELSGFFLKHKSAPFLQKNDYPSPDKRPEVTPEVSMAFRDPYSYNTFLGFANIIEHEQEMARCRAGDQFELEIKVISIPQAADNNTFMAFVRMPGDIQRPRVKSSLHIWFGQIDSQDEPDVGDPNVDPEPNDMELKNPDRWTAHVVDPFPFAPLDTISLILERPWRESHGARQPNLIKMATENADNDAALIENAPFEICSCSVPVSVKQFDQFLACNYDMQHWSNREVFQVLLGGDLMNTPVVDFWENVDQEVKDHVLSHGQLHADVQQMIQGLSRVHGRFFTVTGPAGTGKSYVMTMLTLMQIKGHDFLYPVHPDGATGSWMPTFQNYNKSSGERNDPEKKSVKPQVVIVCPTNKLTSDNAKKLDEAARRILPNDSIMVIRMHPLELEYLVADRRYTLKRTRPVPDKQADPVVQPDSTEEGNPPEGSAYDEEPADDDLNTENVIAMLQTIKEHYDKVVGGTKSCVEGIRDHRLELIELSFGHRMLEVAGMVPDSPFAAPEGSFPNFIQYYEERMNLGGKLEATEEQSFKSDLKRLAKATLRKADVILGTTQVMSQAMMYHHLRPSFVAIDEGGMIKEPDLHPILTYYFPHAFGVFGDPKQLGPTILSTRRENPFRGQLAVPLLARLNFNGAEQYRLNVQQRLAGKIHSMVNKLFYNHEIRWEYANILDPSNYAGQFSDYNMARYQIKSNVVFLNVADGEESMQGYSFVNHSHISLALDLAHDLHTSLSLDLEDIVILTGYEAQRRAYIVEQGRRQHAHSEVKWTDIRAHVIETFQGNEAKVVIFDVVRTKEMGFMRSYRRLNVALSRGRFALYCLYNAGSMTAKVRDETSQVLKDLRAYIKRNRLSAKVQAPVTTSFTEESVVYSSKSEPVSHKALRAANRKAKEERDAIVAGKIASG